MPPRRRPPSVAPAVSRTASDPGLHLDGFIQYLRTECGLAENTIIAYSRDLRRFADWYQDHGPAAFKDVQVSLFVDYLQHLHDHRLAPSSMGRHLVSVKMFFRYLLLNGVISDSVAELVSAPKLWQHLPRVLSPEMVNRLLAAPNRDDRLPLRDRALLALLYATGCRASEVCSLTLNSLVLPQGYCRCVGKGNKERIVSLNPVAMAAIEAYLASERPRLAAAVAESPLLLSARGKPLSRLQVWKLVKRYAARIGASRGVSPHTLRHSFATHLLAGGAEIRALQEMLGHASIRTTQIYTQVDHSRIKAIHEQCHPRG
jgi:integrase/recombinase XerD